MICSFHVRAAGAAVGLAPWGEAKKPLASKYP
jgi:hypothetical protein